MLRKDIKITGIDTVDDSFLIVASFLIICTFSTLKFDLTNGTPITLQSLLVVWFSVALGTRIGLTSVLLYIIAGALGWGVFSGGESGLGYILGINGGFILAFPIGAFIAGSLTQWSLTKQTITKAQFIASALILFISQLSILILGFIWKSAITLSLISISEIIRLYSPGLLIKTAIGTLAIVFISRGLSRIKS